MHLFPVIIRYSIVSLKQAISQKTKMARGMERFLKLVNLFHISIW